MTFTFRSALLLVLLLAAAGAAQTDFHDLVFCGDLSEADCALLESAQENARQQQSGTTAMDMDMVLNDVAGGPPENPDDYSIALDVELAWSGDIAAYEEMGLAAMEMVADPEALLSMYGELLSQINGLISMSLSMPQGLPGASEEEIPEAFLTGFDMEARLVDGVAYVDLSSLATIMPADDGAPSGWLGFNVMDLLEAAMQSAMKDGGMADPRSGHSKSGKSADGAMAEDLAAMEQMVAEWSDPDFLATFMSVERLPDEILNGAAVAVFRSEVDVQAMFNSPAMKEMMRMASEMEGNDVDAADVAFMSMTMGLFAEGLEIETLQYIGLEEVLPARDEFHMSWDLAEMMTMMDGEAGAETRLGVDMLLDYSYPDEAPVISAPENAFIISPGLLLAGAEA